MRIAIRADASVKIGAGHIMRCLTLADEMKQRGAEVFFIIRDILGHMGDSIQQRGYRYKLLSKPGTGHIENFENKFNNNWLGVSWLQDVEETIDAIGESKLNWLIVDHYGIDYKWHNKIRIHASNIMVIDDLANRKLDCDLLLDQTYACSDETYKNLVPVNCKMLLGSKYALLRPEFSCVRPKALEKRQSTKTIQRILVSMGAMDKNNITCQVLDALEKIAWKNKPVIDVVLGEYTPYIDEVLRHTIRNSLLVNVHVSVSNIAELMFESDLAIGAAGSTTWERCCLALPSIVIKLADNQETILTLLDAMGAHLAILKEPTNIVKDIKDNVTQLIASHKQLINLSINSAAICDGNGVIWTGLALDPVLAHDGEKIELIETTMNDAELILKWQSYPETRKYANNQSVPSGNEHIKWMMKTLAKNDSYFWIISHSGEPSGMLRLDYIKDKYAFLISIFVIPVKYRLGIASGALNMAKKVANCRCIYAQVKYENTASVSLFKRAGFTNIETDMYLWKPDKIAEGVLL